MMMQVLRINKTPKPGGRDTTQGVKYLSFIPNKGYFFRFYFDPQNLFLY